MTARYADIVLPAATYLETEDFYRAYGKLLHAICAARRGAQGEAWSNLRLAQALATRMGLKDPVFRMPENELLQELFRGATGAVATIDPGSVRAAGPINIAPKGGQEFLTPSGKLVFYSESLAAKDLPHARLAAGC
jgi:anaerobic selenocysteine-containing dehydrogenase